MFLKISEDYAQTRWDKCWLRLPCDSLKIQQIQVNLFKCSSLTSPSNKGLSRMKKWEATDYLQRLLVSLLEQSFWRIDNRQLAIHLRRHYVTLCFIPFWLYYPLSFFTSDFSMALITYYISIFFFRTRGNSTRNINYHRVQLTIFRYWNEKQLLNFFTWRRGESTFPQLFLTEES